MKPWIRTLALCGTLLASWAAPSFAAAAPAASVSAASKADVSALPDATATARPDSSAPLRPRKRWWTRWSARIRPKASSWGEPLRWIP